jgi:large subunit ribosomal protein L23
VSTRDAFSTIIAPVISEKSYALREEGVYVFEVAGRATKVEVRGAVERLFNVHVVKVNTLNRKGKGRRSRRTGRVSVEPTRKLAYVTLREGERIELLES